MRRITREQFELMHLLRGRGLTCAEIAKVSKITEGRTSVILRCKTWEEFEALKAQERQRKADERSQDTDDEPQAKELERWQFIVGWQSEKQRLQANAVRDLARALGLSVEE